MAAQLRADPALDVHVHRGGFGELRVNVDGHDVVDTSRLWYSSPGSVMARVREYLAERQPAV